MTQQELAEALIKSGGKCFVLFTNCRNCPIEQRPGMSETDKEFMFYCGKNQAERLAWAENYVKEK